MDFLPYGQFADSPVVGPWVVGPGGLPSHALGASKYEKNILAFYHKKICLLLLTKPTPWKI